MWAAVPFSIWFYLVMLLYSAVVIPVLALVVIACRLTCGRRRAMWMFRRCISLYGRGIVSVLTFPLVRVQYRKVAEENESGPYVFVCNHRSSSDPFLMSLLDAEIVQIVNKWPFHLPVWGALARRAGYINVRAMPFEAFKERVIDYLQDNVSIAAFPEGTRSASSKMGQFHGALFRACLEAKAKIVPVCIMGNEDKPRRGSLLLNPGVIRVHQLPCVHFEEYGDMTSFALKNHIRGLIQEYISKTEG